MLVGDPARDREPESGASIRPRAVPFVEAPKDELALLDRNAWAVVGDHQARPPGLGSERDGNGGPRVPRGVVEQDEDQLPQRVLVAGDGQLRGLDRNRPVWMKCCHLSCRLGHQRPHLHGRQGQLEARIGASQRQQPVGEPGHPVALTGDVGGRSPAHIVGQCRTLREEPGVALDGRQRRAQLM